MRLYNFNVLLLNLIPFAVSTWLGLFLLARGAHPRLRLAAFGLLFYAAALVMNNSDIAIGLRLLPPIFWTGAILHLDQRVTDNHPGLFALWQWILLPVTLLLGGFFLLNRSISSNPLIIWISLFIGLTPLFWMLILIRDYISLLKPRQAIGILFIATLFFALGETFLLLPVDWPPQQYILPAIGIDLLFLGFCMAWFDAFDEGETFLPDMLRSFVLTLIIVVIFAGQVGFVIAIQTGINEVMRILLTTTIFASILFSVFGNTLQNKLDTVAFSQAPSIREARARIQIESTILSRRDAGINLSELDEEKRSRLTRRALSHFGDLTRLASNPLTQLPVIKQRLRSRGIPDTTLDRAAELKALLTESIMKLKPQNEKMFDRTDEWRFYNSVFFPYIVGLRPYSRNQEKELRIHEKEAMDWFQSVVPERTLHNWQNTAAKLIANDLWEKDF